MLFVMADLHLSSDRSKSMEIFGARWQDYMEKIKKNWSAVVTEEDTVIVPGDISWSLKLEDSLEDFKFLESLPGKKLIGKGKGRIFLIKHIFASFYFSGCLYCGLSSLGVFQFMKLLRFA